MGNRAVITFDSKSKDTPALYLHWNGGRDSVEGFLLATRILMETRGSDKHYSMARFTQVVGMFLDGNMSYGMGQLKNFGTDQDNGVYVVNTKDLSIKERIYPDYYTENGIRFEEQLEHDSKAIADEIIKRLNAMTEVANEGATYPHALLPTVAEFEAENHV